MLYRFINENEIKKYNGGFVVVNNRIYTNPTEEKIREAGYKELVYCDKPEYDSKTQYLTEVYSEEDTVIKVRYEVTSIIAPIGEIK